MGEVLDKARAAWGDAAADWLIALAEECERTSQARAARRIGYSPATVSGVLNGVYNSDLKAVQDAVEAALMGASVACPALGDIAKSACLEWQAKSKTIAATNPQRLRMARACGECFRGSKP